jgi:hypothetical protein
LSPTSALLSSNTGPETENFAPDVDQARPSGGGDGGGTNAGADEKDE